MVANVPQCVNTKQRRHLRYLLELSPNGVFTPMQLQQAIKFMDESKPVNFTKKDCHRFSEDYGQLIRMGLAKLRDCARDPQLYDRCLMKA